MAFDKKDMSQNSIDDSDIILWKQGSCTKLLIDQIRFEQKKAFKALMKGGAKGHDENAGIYNAYDKVLALIEDA